MALMRKDHLEQIERWAHFVRDNPAKWKKIHTKFINSLFKKHYSFRERLLQTANGKEKLQKLYNIKNINGYKWLKD